METMKQLQQAYAPCSCGGSLVLVGMSIDVDEETGIAAKVSLTWECENCSKKVPKEVN